MGRIWSNGSGLPLNAADLNAVEADIAASTRANPALTVVYNTDGSVQSVTEDGIQTSYTYNADGTVATATRLGTTRTFSYDANGNVTGAA
jgi:YD repeat-containing protein